MRRKPFDPTKSPKTRKELLEFLWSRGVYANVWREGPFYALQNGKVVYATHLRSITTWSFEMWEKEARWVASVRLW